MKLFGRIALAIAIVAGIGAIILSNKLSVQREGLRTDIVNLNDQKDKLTKDLAATRTDLANTKAEWEKTKEELTSTQGDLAATKVKLATKTDEADKLTTSLAGKTAELEQVKTDRDTAQVEIKNFKEALKKAGLDDISNVDLLRDKIAAQTEENQILGKQLSGLRTESATLKERIVWLTTTPANLRGQIAAVQENWGFVVLNVGRDQRVQTNADFLVFRDDKMVTKVQVRSVGETTSVAEILPGFQLSQPRVGDLIVH